MPRGTRDIRGVHVKVAYQQGEAWTPDAPDGDTLGDGPLGDGYQAPLPAILEQSSLSGGGGDSGDSGPEPPTANALFAALAQKSSET